MKTILGGIAIFAYFVVFAMILFAALVSNHCAGGPCLDDQAWRMRLGIIFVGGFALFFGGIYCISRFTRRSSDDDESS